MQVRSIGVLLFVALFRFASAQTATPPATPVRPVIDDYYGMKISDPYRYLENLKDTEVLGWLRAQDAYTRQVLAAIPGRDHLLARFRELDDSATSRVTDVHRLPDDIFFYQKRNAGERTAKLYMRRGMNGPEKLLVDPVKVRLAHGLQSKGESVLLYSRPSNDGKYVAFGIAPGGSEDDAELHVLNTDTCAETSDVLPKAPYYVNWLPDNHSFVFVGLHELSPGAPKTEIHSKIRSYLHVLGTHTNREMPVFGAGVNPSIPIDPMYVSAFASEPGSRYAVGIVDSGDNRASIYTAPVNSIGSGKIPWRKVTDFSDCIQDLSLRQEDLYLRTCKDAPRFKIVRVNADTGDFASAKVIVPEGRATLRGMGAAEDALYIRAMDGGAGRLLRVPYDSHSGAEEIKLPVLGNVNSLISDVRVPGVLYGLSAWTQASRYYLFNPAKGSVTETKLQPVGPYDTPANLRAEKVEVRSHDGVLIPLTITHRSDMKLDGSNPTHLTGYGAYGASQDPNFSPWSLAWYEHGGGIEATCHVRGGGEYGEEWHLAGKGAAKPNTWKDFIACAEYLVQKGYTSPKHLSGYGGSAGGILVGRAITERPDLFGSAILEVPCSDMLRQEITSNGVPNIPEFGSTKTEDGFKSLLAMSPYHHVKDGAAYPGVLVTTGINDPRVDAWQPAKMAARLQAASSSGKPILLRVDWQGGHVGQTEKQLQESIADDMSFDLWQLGAPGFQPAQSSKAR